MNYKQYYPVVSLSVGYVFLFITAIILYYLDFFKGSTIFAFGPPVNITGFIIDTWSVYIFFFFFFALHQSINSCISSIVYPYIINEIQNRKCREPLFNKPVSLLIAFLFYVYSMLDLFLLVSGSYSQISFILGMLVSNSLTTTIINWNHMNQKEKSDRLIEDDSNISRCGDHNV